MLLDNERSREWVKRPPKVLKAMNSRPKGITGKEPDNAIKLEEIDVKNVNYNKPVELDEMRLPSGVGVRYLFAPCEHEGVIDVALQTQSGVWKSMTVYQPILYYLSEVPTRRSFVREELQLSLRIQSYLLIMFCRSLPQIFSAFSVRTCVLSFNNFSSSSHISFNSGRLSFTSGTHVFGHLK